ncbi:ATP-dependent RecD-like DNA helicase [Clostridium gasigenes]|uniref:ATP-dependent RecD2 DNA helicase n=1 Tax=Clostridium gasigenes TaxID=94869 RepID=A0A1H0RWC7_9CLOT|nr:ATP-dependent RecD-like DNA helicase [Clostridium gasigenes]MBB6622624.1 ATP-dependent RecD-like DNA helicase [Clostridium gasigenes]MBU3132811.1 ATP-dependent RecD-like DNA helicase [Clostridium gasigenes]NKF06382.1 ATP-dependent RecD-like DNA helicase [Clostridium gasigenes]QSW20263.1 ATP-dependent RecD-like DNA helicase [Clostridium gasigenes]SDP33720.1 exodeoxyribonuclease V alpha subunit [Clostridium gasigenes]
MEVLSGLVESILFKSDDTGYVVAKVEINKEIIAIVGILPFLKESQHVKLKGQWMLHKQFGRQFKVEECEEVLPDSIEGIVKYLSTGVVHGIGPVTAKKIVAAFGDKTLDIMDNHIERLKEIEGIGEKKFEIIYESYIEQKDLKDIMIHFQGHGMTPNQCIKIYKKFGPMSKDIVSENPYILSDEISGIGFMTADKIAKNIGIESTSDFRIQSGIKYVLNQFSLAGNTYMPKDELIKEVVNVLDVTKELIEENIYNATLENKIKIEKINDVEAVFSLPYYYCELGVTNKIITLSIENFRTINTDVEFEVEQFEKDNNIEFAEAQREAIIGAFDNGIEIITGGPGTGKTTIIKSIIEIYEKNNMKVLLAAPTGRAAKRMAESTGREAKTIHRLLEVGTSDDDKSFFGKGESSPLEGDVIIIDEASMIDIMLMQSLLKAIQLGTRVIIVGDVDQLPSVGPGNVLKDLIESDFIKVVRLNAVFRQGKESMIVTNAHKINNGEMPCLNKKDGDFFFDHKEDNDEILDTIIDLINRRLPKFNPSLDKLKDIQILTPMRKGILGVQNLNNKLQESLNPPSSSKKEKEIKEIVFREGDKVMQTKNNYQIEWFRINGYGDNEGKGVFNGDMGFIQSINENDKNVIVIFDDEKKVIYDYISLDELDLAYAITIHKSQGSEFKVVITPAFMGSPFLMNRNLLYTGITRAKELVVVVGKPKALKYMVDNTNSSERYSSLKDRILEITAGDNLSE